MQGNVSHALNNAESLPFVGKQLGDFGAANSFASIQTPLTNALNLLPDPASDDLIRTTIFNAFSSAGIALNSIDTIADRGESGSGPDQVSVRHPANLGTGGVAIEMQIHLTPTVASATFDTGLPSLPFKVTAKGAVTVAVGIDYELAFQYNATTHQPGLNTSALLNHFEPADSAHEMAVTVTATIPDFNATATIGFMEGSLTPTAGKPPSAFHGTFTLDNLTNPQTPNLDGQADVYLTLSGGFGSADNEFPTVDADFELHWKFDSNNPTANPPAVSFSNVKLDLGQFMNSVLLPVLQSIQRETQPFKPVLDVLNAPIPGLSDISNFLGEGNVTLLELATIGADQAGYGEVANLVSNLATLVDTINGLNLHSGGGSRWAVSTSAITICATFPQTLRRVISATLAMRI